MNMHTFRENVVRKNGAWWGAIPPSTLMQFGLSHVFGRVAPGTSGSGMKVYVVYLVQKQKEIDPEWRVRQALRQIIGKQEHGRTMLLKNNSMQTANELVHASSTASARASDGTSVCGAAVPCFGICWAWPDKEARLR